MKLKQGFTRRFAKTYGFYKVFHENPRLKESCCKNPKVFTRVLAKKSGFSQRFNENTLNTYRVFTSTFVLCMAAHWTVSAAKNDREDHLARLLRGLTIMLDKGVMCSR